MPTVSTVPSGTRGFDCNAVIDTEGAVAFFEKGYRFAMRYVRRGTMRTSDLGTDEIQRLHDAGLAVGIVQHVESESSWVPSPEKGQQYGETAAEACTKLSIPAGVVVWNDLEGVAKGTDLLVTIAHCNAWYDAVFAAGYVPGCYVGWRCGLTPDQLYHKLKFAHWWGAYNLNADEEPSVRGLQMKQHAATSADVPAEMTFPIDTDTVTADHLGGFPTVFAPDGWLT